MRFIQLLLSLTLSLTALATFGQTFEFGQDTLTKPTRAGRYRFAALGGQAFIVPFSGNTIKLGIAGAGISQSAADLRYALLSGSYANPAWLTSLAAAKLTGTLAAAQFPALTGEVTTTAGALGASISSGAVTNAKLANAPAGTHKGNNTGSAAAPADLTVADTKTLLALNNVDNTSDANKPVSTAQLTAIAAVRPTCVTGTAVANGGTISNPTGSTDVAVLFYSPATSNTPDPLYRVSSLTTTLLTIGTPHDGSAYETFTGKVCYQLRN